jgi:hypothetical protein
MEAMRVRHIKGQEKCERRTIVAINWNVGHSAEVFGAKMKHVLGRHDILETKSDYEVSEGEW